MAGTGTITMHAVETNGVHQPTKNDTNDGTVTPVSQGLLQSVTSSVSKGKLTKLNESHFADAHNLWSELCSKASKQESSI
jgi:hypothetical protein